MLTASFRNSILFTFAIALNAFQTASASLTCSESATRRKNLPIVQAVPKTNHNSKNFEIRDAENSWVKFIGHLDDGILAIDASLISPSQTLRSSHNGTELYREMMAHFGSDKIRLIEEAWYGGTNMEMFMDGFENGLSMKEAAKETWSGRMAAEFGFTEVTKADFAMDRIQNRSFISVEFRRPQ